MKTKLFSQSLLISLLCSITAYGNEKNTPPPLEDWDQVLPASIVQEIQSTQARKIPSLLMKALDRVTLGSFSAGKSKIKLKLQRKVYNNNDLENTWSVLDRIEIKGKTPILDKMQLSALKYGFYLGTIHHIDFYNIRQVTPGDYKNIPSIDYEKQSIEKNDWYLLYQNDENEETIDIASGMSSDRLIDFDDILNRLKFPLRIPLRVESLSKLSDGEIISYSATGGVTFGTGVGWQESPVDYLGRIRAGVRVGTLLSGVYQISIQKENSRFAQVNVSRTKSIGSELKLGVEADPDILEGIFLVERLSGHLEIVPFQFTAQREVAKNFNVTYRYDLSSSLAQEAYEAAVKGNFKISEDLTIDEEGNKIPFASSGVERLQTEKKHTDDKILKSKIKLTFLFKKENKKKFSKVETMITLPDGQKKTFQVASERESEFKLFRNKHQKLSHAFTVSVDLDAVKENPLLNPYELTVSSRVEDERTQEDHMMAAILNLEDTIGKFGVFNRPPRFSEPVNSNFGSELGVMNTPIAFPRGHLRNSRFYSQLQFNSEHVNKFIHLSESEMWSALEEVYGVRAGLWQTDSLRTSFENTGQAFSVHSAPFFASELSNRNPSSIKEAQSFYKNWLIMRAESGDVNKKAIALARLFHKTKGKYEVTKLLRVVNDQEKSHYVASGYSPIFGRIRLWGETVLQKEDIATQMQLNMDRENRSSDSPSQIVDVQMIKINEKQYELSFSLPVSPKLMSFHLLLDKKWWKIGEKSNQAQLLFPNENKEYFKQGENKIVLDKQDKSSPWYELIKNIKSNRKYTLVLTSNPSGYSWGENYGIEF